MKKNNKINNPHGPDLARRYLKLRPFSKASLIDQLQFDGCGNAVEIVENMSVDWEEQCCRMIRYMQESGQGETGTLEELLTLEGFEQKMILEAMSKKQTD